jgi:hypothetical protein
MEKRVKRILGIPVFTTKISDCYEKRYFLGVQYKVKHLHKYINFAEALKENMPQVKNRQVKVIINNLGEAVIYARTAEFWYQPGTLLLASKAGHAEIFKMFAPQLPVFFLGRGTLDVPLDDQNGNHIEAILFDRQLINMNNSGEHFYKSWEKYLKADFSKISYKKAIVSEDIDQTAKIKAQALGVNPDNFVFLMPAASSVDLLPEKFWQDIEQDLRAKGFDVLYNNPKLFSVQEAYVLAGLSKAIVAMRSGFCDVLCELEVPQYIIYSHNKWHGDLQPMYDLTKFPWAAKDYIHEYNTLTQPAETVKQEILEGIARAIK